MEDFKKNKRIICSIKKFNMIFKRIIYYSFLKINHLFSYFRLLKFFVNPNIKIGKKVYIGKGVKISNPLGGTVEIGDNCEIHDFTQILTYGGDIRIGNFCSFNPFCVIYGHGGLNIGNYVRVAAQVVIIPVNHTFSDRNKPIHLQGEVCKGISIMDDVWIGAGSKILDGIIVDRGSVIGAGSVVTKSVDSFSIYAGVPAKKIKDR
jgi:acetyltransferase-like isoleucine patch superfamily enzyme